MEILTPLSISPEQKKIIEDFDHWFIIYLNKKTNYCIFYSNSWVKIACNLFDQLKSEVEIYYRDKSDQYLFDNVKLAMQCYNTYHDKKTFTMDNVKLMTDEILRNDMQKIQGFICRLTDGVSCVKNANKN